MQDEPHRVTERRPLATRDRQLSKRVAQWLIARGVSPNAISILSIVCGAIAGLALACTERSDGAALRILFLGGAAMIQLRLVANMLDGMVAIGSGKTSRLGELYNEVPDRIADPLILIGAGLAAGGSEAWGYLAAAMALFVAYVRAIGAAAGAGQAFHGPQAKPHRMALLTAGCLYSALAPPSWPGAAVDERVGAVTVVLVLIFAGGAITAVRRLRWISAQLDANSS